MQILRRRPRDKPRDFNFEWDYRNPEWPVQGLGSVILCNERGGLPFDLITKQTLARNAASSSFGTHRDLTGVLCDANDEGFRYTTPASLKPVSLVTLFIRLRHLAAPSGTNPGFGGCTWNTSNSSPFSCYNIGYLTSSSQIYAGWNLNGTTSQFGGSSQNYDLTQVCNYCMVLTGSNMNLYKNAVRIDSNPAQAGNIGYNASNIINVGEPYASSRNPNVLIDCMYIWPDVALSAEQVKAISTNPFGLFRPRDRVLYSFPTSVTDSGGQSIVVATPAGTEAITDTDDQIIVVQSAGDEQVAGDAGSQTIVVVAAGSEAIVDAGTVPIGGGGGGDLQVAPPRFRRRTIGGLGQDTTHLVAEWLLCGNTFHFADLYLIGEPDDPQALYLTNWESPLLWKPWGTFLPAVIKRGPLARKIGLEVDALEIEWSPPAHCAFTQSLETANPYQRARLGFYDNWPFRLWTAYMPVPGDAHTFGAGEEFGGRLSNVKEHRGLIKLTVNSFLDVVNQNVPTNVIEITNTLAGYSGARPPADHDAVPKFEVITGSTQTKLIVRETSPNADHLFDDNELRGGFLVFDKGGSQTLGGAWCAIYANRTVNVGGTDYNEIVLYSELPWPPTPGTDTCYISAAFPLDQAEGEYQGFPYVPSPNSAI